jgi:hypothetical protein
MSEDINLVAYAFVDTTIFASHILSAEEKEKLVEICSEYRSTFG